MRPRVLKLLEDVREAATVIQSYLADVEEADFVSDIMRRDAVQRRFEIIGEALRRLYAEDGELAARIPDVPQIVAFRNVLAHGYDAVDDHRVWRIAQQRLPPLLGTVSRLIDEELKRP
jgi:uncharacterized protein with HEPN domain